MINFNVRIVLLLCTLVLCVYLGCFVCPVEAADALPSGVNSRLKKIDDNMKKVESSISENKANHSALGWAQNALEEIKSQYPANANVPEVRSAEERIEKGRLAIENLEKSKADEKQNIENAENEKDKIAEEWADRLAPYRAETKENSKGNYGVPMSEPDKIAALKPQYEEAKSLYAEFLATGIDKESHWKLREAEYNIRVAIENYESSGQRVLDEAINDVDQTLTWLKRQKTLAKPIMYSSSQMQTLTDRVQSVQALFAGQDKLDPLNEKFAEVMKLQGEIELIVLKNRKMKPDVYKGKDAQKVKTLAKSIVLKEDKKIKILRVHITSRAWTTEAATEWTDTTKTAVQHRVTKGLYVQVALTRNNEYFLYTLFVNKNTIGGATGALQGHVMHKDKFLKANLPK